MKKQFRLINAKGELTKISIAPEAITDFLEMMEWSIDDFRKHTVVEYV